MVVPSFWSYEIASIFSKAAANNRLPEAEARNAVEDLLDMPQLFCARS